MRLIAAIATLAMLTPSLAVAQPLPQPKAAEPGESCPRGYASSGSFCGGAAPNREGCDLNFLDRLATRRRTVRVLRLEPARRAARPIGRASSAIVENQSCGIRARGSDHPSSSSLLVRARGRVPRLTVTLVMPRTDRSLSSLTRMGPGAGAPSGSRCAKAVE